MDVLANLPPRIASSYAASTPATETEKANSYLDCIWGQDILVAYIQSIAHQALHMATLSSCVTGD